MKKNRPVLRYHGGKWRIATWIIKHIPEHRTYIEPFCGAASVLIRKPKSTVEVINDLNNRVISVFKILRDPQQSEKLRELIFYTPYSNEEYLQAVNISPDPVEDARRVLILGHQSFGGRSASGGKLSGWKRGVRKSRETTSADEWQDLHSFIDGWSNRLRSVFIENRDAFDLISRWDAKDAFFYVDPPYVSSSRSGSGKDGYAYEMSDDQHVKLSELLHNIKGQAFVSGYNSELYDNLYSDWMKLERDAMADAGNKTVECLWVSKKSGKLNNFLF